MKFKFAAIHRLLQILLCSVVYTALLINVQAAEVCFVDEDFDSLQDDWIRPLSHNCKRGKFVVGTPNLVVTNKKSVKTQVDGDHTSGTGSALFTRSNRKPGKHDVDKGECAIQSPVYPIIEDAELSIWYFHGQRDSGDDPTGDYFKLEVSTDSGNSWSSLASYGDEQTEANWTQATTAVSAGDLVTLRARVSDGVLARDTIEAGIDDLKICASVSNPDPKKSKGIIEIATDALYQLSGQELLDNGVDLIGVPVENIAMSHQGHPIPIIVSASSSVFLPDTLVQFHGIPAESIYTDKTTYAIENNSDKVDQVTSLDPQLIQASVENIRPGIIDESLYDGVAEYLIISPSQFIDELDDLVQLREQTYSVKIVNVDALYDSFGDGMFGGPAIKNYIKFAAENLSTGLVLLVGDDRDNYKDPDGWSGFIPTVYTSASSLPADALLADIDGDLLQDLAIGRFPIDDSAELANIINKTLAYNQVNPPKQVMVLEKAVTSDLNSHFRITSLQSALDDWALQPIIDIDETGDVAAKTQLIDTINQGAGLIYWLGGHRAHDWSPTFTSADVMSLTNSNLPVAVIHEDSYQHDFTSERVKLAETLIASPAGAVISLGTSGLFAGVQNGYARIFAANKTIGAALVDYQQNAGVPNIEAAKYGYSLFGDPAVIIRR